MLDSGQVRELLMQGLQQLKASDSDWAREENGIGFAKCHTEVGRRLVDGVLGLPDAWSVRDAYIAWQVCSYYKRTQLAHLPWANMPKPPMPKSIMGRRGTEQSLPKVSLVNATLRFEFPYDKGFRVALSAAKGRWSPDESEGWDKSVWYVGLVPHALEPIISLWAEWPLDATQEAEDAVHSLYAKTNGIVEASRAMTAEALEVPGMLGTLRPFQSAGVRFALEHEKVFIADEMGTGKSLQALATVASASDWPVLIVCPASLKLNWAKEIIKWMPHEIDRTVILGSSPSLGGSARRWRVGKRIVSAWPDDNTQIYIVNYDILHKWYDTLLGVEFRAVIFDECHYLKTGTTQRTKAAMLLATGWHTGHKAQVGPGIKRRIMMSGTPMLNRPQELVSQLAVLGRLREFGGAKGFLERYCDPKPGWGMRTDYSGASNLEELNRRLGLFMLRRTKKMVLSELPSKSRIEVLVEITNRSEYDRAARDVIEYVREKMSHEDVASEILSMHDGDVSAWETAIENKVMAAENAEWLVRIAALKRLAAHGKKEAAKEWIKEFLESGKKLVVFCWHRDVAQEYAEMLGAPLIIGGIGDQERSDAVDKFQSDPETRVIVCNVKAGGVGLTLTAASDVLMLELGWSPGEMDQAEDRIHRIGQEEPCTVYYLLGNETIDEQIFDLIEAKRVVSNKAIDSKSIYAGLLSKIRQGQIHAKLPGAK